MRAVKSWGLAFILVVIMGAWMVTGTLVQGGKGPHDGEVTVTEAIDGGDGPVSKVVEASGMAVEPHHEEGVTDPALSIAERSTLSGNDGASLRSVRTQKFTMGAMPLDVTLRGTTAAYAKVQASARTGDIIKTVDVEVGQRVAQGDLICSLDTGTRQAAIDQAQASVAQASVALEKARNDLATNAALREKGLASPNSGEAFQTALSGAEAAYEAASVGLRNRQVELENTEIRATVPGIIQRPVARVGDLLNPGQSCATIIQLDPMTFNSAVPQAHIGLARIGLEAEIRTIDNHVATGKVSYVAASADAATRTFPVEIEFSNPDGVFLDGQTASAVVSLGSVPATLIPQSITTLAPDGQLGVQGVVDGTVKFYPVTIINDTNEGAWVTGLPLVAEIIIVGQDYVSEGQTVDATLVN